MGGTRRLQDAWLMTRHFHISRILSLLLLLCAGCGGSSTRPDQTPLGKPFELRAGTSANLDEALTITFERVSNDSRCPMDVVCIWAGDAVVSVSISQGAGGWVRRELHTDPSGSETSYSMYSVKLLALSPYPRSDRQIRPEDYVARLSVAPQ
jgi:hypothetical protein